MFSRKWEIQFVSDQVTWLTQERSNQLSCNCCLERATLWTEGFQLSQREGSSKGTCQVPPWLLQDLLSLKASLILPLPQSFSKHWLFTVMMCFHPNSLSSLLTIFGNFPWFLTLYPTHTLAHKYLGNFQQSCCLELFHPFLERRYNLLAGRCLTAVEALNSLGSLAGCVQIFSSTRGPPADELKRSLFLACLIICLCLHQFHHHLMVLTLIMMITIMAMRALMRA